MSIADYFAQPDATRIILIEVAYQLPYMLPFPGLPIRHYYLSDTPYASEAGDTPPSHMFTPLVAAVPEFRRSLAELSSGGQASTSYGTVELAGRQVHYINAAGESRTTEYGDFAPEKGARVTIRLAAPAADYVLADALILATGYVNRLGGSTDGGAWFEVADDTADIKDKLVSATPICWGICRNITPQLIDPATLKYQVNLGEVDDITAVYDDGVALTYPGQYTKLLSDGAFALATSPAGLITCDVRGHKAGGMFLQSTAQVMQDILTRVGYTPASTDFSSLPTGSIGLYVTNSTTLGELFDQLTTACAAFWCFSRLGGLIAQLHQAPSSPAISYGQGEILDEASWETLESVYGAIPYSYRKNWTQYQARAGATAAQAEFAAGTGLTGLLLPAMYPGSTVVRRNAPMHQTLFDDAADALAMANRIADLHRRSRLSIDVVLPWRAGLALGQCIALDLPVLGGINGVVTEVADVFSADYPQQRVKVLA